MKTKKKTFKIFQSSLKWLSVKLTLYCSRYLLLSILKYSFKSSTYQHNTQKKNNLSGHTRFVFITKLSFLNVWLNLRDQRRNAYIIKSWMGWINFLLSRQSLWPFIHLPTTYTYHQHQNYIHTFLHINIWYCWVFHFWYNLYADNTWMNILLDRENKIGCRQKNIKTNL